MSNKKQVDEVINYFQDIVRRMQALKPSVWQWDLGIKKLAIHVPPPEYTDLQRTGAQYAVPMTEEEIIFMCHARTDIDNLIRMNMGQANEIAKLRSKVAKLKKKVDKHES